LRVNDIFYSIQGEGLDTGKPTIFVRTGRCNLKCDWCDTNFKEPVKVMTSEQVLKKVEAFKSNNLCVTGGEPLMEEDMLDFLNIISRKGYDITIETNGSIDVEPFLYWTIVMDIKCPSSQMAKFCLFANLAKLKERDQVKFVIKDRGDYIYAKRIIKRYITKANLLMSPVFDKELLVAHQLSTWILKDKMPVRLQVQVHRLLHLK